MPSTEVLLAVALVAVYLFDSMQFLRIGEVVVLTRGGVPRALSFGGSFELSGRRPFIPNPLTPFRPDFRLGWDISGGATADAAVVSDEMRTVLRATRPLGWLASACAISIVLVAPIALAAGEQLVFLAAAAASLCAAFAGCLLVVLRKQELALSTMQVCSLVFVALVCLPCAPNLARAVALQRKWTLAARDLPRLGFDVSRSAEVHGRIVAALSTAKRYVAEESPEFKVIDEQIRQLGSCEP